MTRFDDYIREVEERAKAEGPEAVARWDAFNAHSAMMRELRHLRKGTPSGRMGETWQRANQTLLAAPPGDVPVGRPGTVAGG